MGVAAFIIALILFICNVKFTPNLILARLFYKEFTLQGLLSFLLILLLLGIPFFYYLRHAYKRSIEKDVISYKKQIWAVWASIAIQVIGSLWLLGFAVLLFILEWHRANADISERLISCIFIIACPIALLKFFKNAIQPYKNRFDRIYLFNDRVEIINSHYVPEHLIIQFSEIQNTQLLTSRNQSEFIFKLQINDHIITLKDVNLNSIAGEVYNSLQEKLNQFRDSEKNQLS
jgi:hypothetical protein